MNDYIEHCFLDFVKGIQNLVTEHREKNFPTLGPVVIGHDYGRKYWRIWKKDQGTSVYGFVRKEDGAIFMPAGWKGPQTKTKTAIRGYVTDDYPLDYVGAYGVKYAA
tara:strand:+ start:80 stop:400 length:321 start_codon:yes stop_codon:yes gene_type:complete